MIIIPKELPVIEKLNSYYLNINRLVEHYQGELGAGVVYFRTAATECALFFDEYNIVNGCCEEKQQKTGGQAAINLVMEMAPHNNFSVSVYRISSNQLYFWANLSNSELIYNGLTTEFTDLEGLIRKMESEKLTGYIDVQLNGDFKGGLLFFFNGEIIGGLSQDDKGNPDRSSVYKDELITSSREFGGKFNVSRIFLDYGESNTVSPIVKSAVKEKKDPPKKQKSAASAPKTEAPETDMATLLRMLESLLGTMDRLVGQNRKIRLDFETLLSKKFVEKIDKFEFLDPFAADFRYSDGKVSYTGDVGCDVLAGAISECVLEIAQNIGITSQLRKDLHSWRKEFADAVIEYDLRL